MQIKLNATYLILGAMVIVLVLLSVYQHNSTGQLRQQNKTYQQQINNLKQQNIQLQQAITADSLKINTYLQQVDSLTLLDKRYSASIKTISKKYENLLHTYNNASNAAKDSIFSNLINN